MIKMTKVYDNGVKMTFIQKIENNVVGIILTDLTDIFATYPDSFDRGYYNGYVVVNKHHPLYEKKKMKSINLEN